jgi:class 3 adenylate cyclase/streptogramin lyase
MPERRIATVLMLDVVGSTNVAAQLGDARYRELSSRFDRIVRATLKRFGGREEDHAGDGFFATFAQPDRAIRCAAALADDVRTLGVEIRSGIHTGQTESQEGRTHGIAVVIGARVMSLAGAGEILVTSTTKELVTGSGFGFEDFSAHELKGVPGTWQVYAVTGVDDRERGRPLPAAEAAERRAAIHPSTGRERPPPKALVAAGLALLIAIAGFAFAATRDGSIPPSTNGTKRSKIPAPESVVQVDPANGRIISTILAPVPQGGHPGFTPPTSAHSMAVGQGGLWTVRFRNLFHVDPSRSEVRTRLEFPTAGGIPFSVNLAVGSDKIWIAYGLWLLEVNPATDEQQRAMTLGTHALETVATDVVVGEGYVWVGTSDGRLVRYDPRTGEGRIRTGLDSIDAIAFGQGAVWTVDAVGGTVRAYDPDTMRPGAPIAVRGTDSLLAGEAGIWILGRSLGVLTRIDPSTGEITGEAPVGPSPTGLTSGGGAIWVGDKDGVIRRVDEDTRVVSEIPFGAEIRALAYDNETDTLWIDVA